MSVSAEVQRTLVKSPPELWAELSSPEALAKHLGELGDIPVQVVWGAEDRIIPARHADGLPAAVRTHVLAGAGHMPHVERASEVGRLVLEFVG